MRPAAPPIDTLIPHQGRMCLLQRVVEWNDARVHCRTATHRDPGNPLRGGHGLRAVHLCEYGAQAMAVHGGLLALQAGTHARPGLLVSLRAVRLYTGRIDALEGDIDIEAERLLGTASSWQYAFRARHRTQLLAEGRAAVVLLD